ncbi:Choline dehydrogenase [Colletotrichum higginsianum IMI 349063]|uniref:Choline dehydrogenase n=1 Tax=Colletotrichum higginsianum (strain IMI 349063) TaxID=759273 RepID=A0A1B7Y311_COLHI|nr:Choline dehydrogenase [Colletotrichum higginsianum IMI 349063]OBR06394.1 Choline dehydrogenase [Colletotrichum higginsianum IMI 349063]
MRVRMKASRHVIFAAASVVSAELHGRQTGTIGDSYDYVIVGGGTAGLTLASRLSSDPSTSGFAPGTRYDWNLTSVAQESLQGQVVNLTQGHAVGGSSTVNAMIFDRGMPSNYDAWAALGNDGWDFGSLLPYFKKSERFTPASPENTALFDMTYDPDCHGFEGPVQSSYLAWSHPNNSLPYPDLSNFLNAMEGLGISTPDDQGCNPLGAYLTTHSIDPRNQSRSSARTAHYDSILGRANLHIATGQQATKVLFDTSGEKPRAQGVEFSAGPDSVVQRVTAGKEVIVSTGALNTPKLLQLSGIGPATVISQFGIASIVDLPGVGANLQDHPFGLTLASLSDGVPGNYELDNATFDAEQRDLYYSERRGRWTDTIAEALAFIPLFNFTTLEAANRLLSAIDGTSFLPPGTDETVVAGYEKQLEQLHRMHQSRSTAGMELLYVDGGRSVVNILMHPLSRGTVLINSSDPFLPPLIDPRYFSHPYDGQVLVESLRFNRELLATAPIQALGAVETLPGAATQSDEEILTFIKGVTSTEFHYSGTCAMLPRALGGVVGSDLKVYGVDGLRVVDASIMPLVPSAHTQATVYAIAEKAADMILGQRT